MTYKGKVTDLYINQLADGRLMHVNSWIEPDGWMTDAYMLAVSYPEGTDPALAKDFFIGHGSILRRGTSDTRFSSLSKLNVIAEEKGGKLNMQVTGQPTARISYKSGASAVSVNGKK